MEMGGKMTQIKTVPTESQIQHWLAMATQAMHNPSTPMSEHNHAYAVWVLAQECLEHRTKQQAENS